MPLSRSRDYLSIGEVLESVRADFPDISISKIRFLESEGLIAPERTRSGYRKFFEGDIERLRYILELQRDHFLPLRVIKERLAESDAGRTTAAGNGSGTAAPAPPDPPFVSEPAADLTGLSLSKQDLKEVSGLSDAELGGLMDFGILDARADDRYDENDLLLAKAAGRFFAYGVEPRHLKMYRQFAEREASFFQQIVMPVARRRDPEGGRQASESIRELVALAHQLREAVLRSALREHL